MAGSIAKKNRDETVRLTKINGGVVLSEKNCPDLTGQKDFQHGR